MENNHDILAEKGSFEYRFDEDELYIKSKLDLTNSSNAATALFTALTFLVFVGTISVGFFLFSAFVFFLFVFCLATLLKQDTDYIRVTSSEIEWMNSLKHRKYPLHSSMRFKIEERIEYAKRKGQPGSGTHFRITEFYLKVDGEEFRIFDYQIRLGDIKSASVFKSKVRLFIKKKISESTLI